MQINVHTHYWDSEYCPNTTVIPTREELSIYVQEKMDIVDDFFDKRSRLSKKVKDALETELLSLTSMRAIDVHFRTFIDAHT